MVQKENTSAGGDPATDDRDALSAQIAKLEGQLRHVLAETLHMKQALVGLQRATEIVAPDPVERDRLYDTKALAERWGVSERTIDTEVAEGNVVPTFIRGARRFTFEAIREYERTNSGLRRRRAGLRRKAARKNTRTQDRPAVAGQAS